MNHVIGALVAGADAGTESGRQFQQVVVLGAGGVGIQGGGEVGHDAVVARLGGQGPQGGPRAGRPVIMGQTQYCCWIVQLYEIAEDLRLPRRNRREANMPLVTRQRTETPRDTKA